MNYNQTRLIGEGKFKIGDQITIFYPTRYLTFSRNGTVKDIRVKKKRSIRYLQYKVCFPGQTRTFWYSESYLNKFIDPAPWYLKLLNQIKKWIQF